MRTLHRITLLFLVVIPCLGQAAALQEFLANPINTDMVSLDLRYKQIRDAGAIALAEALKVNTSLTSLGLRNNEIGDAGAIALAKALKVNTSLTSLDLHYNEIGVAGAIALAEALKVNTTLTTLDLRINQIGAAGAIALETIRKRLIRNGEFSKVKYYATLLSAGRFPIQLSNEIWTCEIFDALRIQIESEIR